MKNYNSKLKIIAILVLSFSLFTLNFKFADAARLFFEPEPTSYKVGDEFTLSLFLDTENESINAVEIGILVPELLRIKNISKNGSVIQLWIQEPSFSGGTINLTGGIPGGLKVAKGLIAKISLRAVAIGQGNISFLPNSSVLLNDGQGTKLDLKTAGGPVFNVIPRPRETITTVPKPGETIKEEEPQVGEAIDKKKPDKFEILFGKDPRVFGGENFVSFFTTDPDSGIDHYEIKIGKEPFTVAQSPYLIGEIAPRTVIRVRAYDYSGNFREAVYPGFLKRLWWSIINILWWITSIYK